jgi:hypothetical protein
LLTSFSAPIAPSFLEETLGGVASGLQEGFFTGGITNYIADQIPGYSAKQLSELSDRLDYFDSTVSNVFQVVGKYGPDFLVGGGIYSLGRRGAVSLAARLANPTTNIARRHAADAAAQEFIRPDRLERVTRVLGGNVALSTAVGGQTYINDDDLTKAAQAGLISLALGTAFEGGIMALGAKLNRGKLFPESTQAERFKPAFREATDLLEGPPKFDSQGKIQRAGRGRQVVRDTEKGLRYQVQKTNLEIATLTNQARYETRMGLWLKNDLQTKGAWNKLSNAQRKKIQAKIKAVDEWESGEKLNLVQERGLLETQMRSLENFVTDPTSYLYTRENPFNPQAVRLMFSQLWMQMGRTPESFRGALGPTWARVFQSMEQAEIQLTLARAAVQSNVQKLKIRAGHAMGIQSKKQMGKPGTFLDVSGAWEDGGEAGVRAWMTQKGRNTAQADEMVKVFQELDNMLTETADVMSEMGADVAVNSAAALKRAGLAKFLPHRMEDLPEREMIKRLVDSGVLDETEAADWWLGFSRDGLGKMGSSQFNLKYPGSLRDKITNQQLPYSDDIFGNIYEHLNSSHRRIAYGRIFGSQGELRDHFMLAVRREAGSGAEDIARTITEAATNTHYYPQAMRQFTRIVTGGQIASKLTLAVIPNMSQGINNVLFGGFRNTTRGLRLALNKRKRDEIIAALGAQEHLPGNLARALSEGQAIKEIETGVVGKAANAMDWLAETILRSTGFSAVEKWNRITAGSMGQVVFRDTIAKASAGKLRGLNLDVARRRLETMGVDLTDVVRRIHQEGDGFLLSQAYKDIERAAVFKASQMSQFTPGVFRRPLAWNHPLGKVLTQFKSFGLNQGRFVRDQVFTEAAHGNMKPLAYFLSIYPVAGEMVGDVRNTIKATGRKEDNAVQRVVNDFLMVGGMGLMTDTFMAAQYGGLWEQMFGPTFSDIFTMSQALMGQEWEVASKTITGQPAFQAGLGLAKWTNYGVQEIQEYNELRDADSPSPGGLSVVDFGTARHQRIRELKGF